MKVKIDNGQITFATERVYARTPVRDSWCEDGLRIQFYWPKFQWKNSKKGEHPWQCARKEFFFSAATNFRITWEEGYWGCGGNVLGFGAAADYKKEEKNSIK